MQKRIDEFLNLSMALTGASRIQLTSKGVADEYLNTLAAILPAGMLDDLFAATTGAGGQEQREAAIANLLHNDPKLGEILARIILLWYTGSWQPFSDTWHAAYGTPPNDKNHVVSEKAYEMGLQWKIGESHAPGGSGQGFASWSRLNPGRSSR